MNDAAQSHSRPRSAILLAGLVIQTSAALWAATPAPVAHWTFDTDLKDCIGGLEGEPRGNVRILPHARGGKGALQVDGKRGDYVKVAASPRLTTPDFTQMYWVKSDPQIQTSIGGMCRRITGWDGFAFETDWNVHPDRFEIRWWNGTWHAGFAGPQKDTWLHLTWVYDAGHAMLALYVNGRIASLEADVKIDRAKRALYLGGTYHEAQNFRGLIDDLRLFDSALNAPQIQALLREAGAPVPAAAAPEGTEPAGQPLLRFDFESGNLQGWTVIDGHFAKLLNDRVMFRNRKQKQFNKQGTYFLDTVETGWDRQTGIVESPVFVLSGPEMSMLIGGGKHADTYLALCTTDGAEVLTMRGVNDEVFQPRKWDAPKLVGMPVFLRIVDGNRGGWGHVLLDDFRACGWIDMAATAKRNAERKQNAERNHARAQLALLPTDAVRAAVEDLMRTFPEHYANGPRFLQRLAALKSERDQLLERASDDRDETFAAIATLAERFRSLQHEALTANPLVSTHPILFVVRQQYKRDHHNTATLFQTGEINTSKFQGGSAIKTLDLSQGGKVTTLLELADGVTRDPEVHFSGRKIVFAMRRNIKDDYHIYEMAADGTSLRQLTRAPAVSDIDPLYLADESIAFSSTREPKYCMCNRHIMANLFRMGPDGSNIHQIGKSTLFEGHGALMPDGRILYYRWEYVDRNFGDAQGLWTVNPDGTNHALYWGNNTASPGAVIDARPIPGTEQVVCIFGSCHDRPWGALAILDRRRGIDADSDRREPVRRTWPESAMKLVGVGNYDTFLRVFPRYEDPYPLSQLDADGVAGIAAGAVDDTAGKYFLVSRSTDKGDLDKGGIGGLKMGIYLVDVFGNEVLLHAEEPGCFDPMPLCARPRPGTIPARRDFRDRSGRFCVLDVYQGTHMQGVEPGAVKWLRVVESPEKRFWTGPQWNGQGNISPAMNWHDFNNKRILGTVPVEPDGSAYFSVPADTFVYFQLLDGDGMMIQSMRSGTMVQSGELTGCVGCHEHRLVAPPPATASVPAAFQREPGELEGWHGPPRLFSYLADVQPVFDRHCVRCHDFGQDAGARLNLAADKSDTFNVSYNELWRRKCIRAIGAGPHRIQQAYSWGSHASKLVKTIRQGHQKVTLDKESFDRIVTWVDINAPYYPSYASAYPGNLAGRSPLTNAELKRLGALAGLDFFKLTSYHANQGPKVSFDRPELSPCLAAVKAKAPEAIEEALDIIRKGQERLANASRGDTADFAFCPLDQQREGKYTSRQKSEAHSRQAIAMGEKVMDAPEAAAPAQ